MAKAKSNFSFDVIKKNLFWICVPLAIVVMWGLFIFAHSKTKADYASRMNDLDSLHKTVVGIKGETLHPNQKSIAAALESEGELRGIVYEAWVEMYNAQKINCTWSTKLNSVFLDVVLDLKWMDPIPKVETREWYNTFIAKQIPEFLKMADRRTVSVRVMDEKTNDWKRDENGEIIYISIDPYVEEAEKMIREMAVQLGGNTGVGGSSSSSSMGGGAGGFMSFGTTGGTMGGSQGSGSADGSMGMLAGMASSAGLSLDNIFDLEYQKVEGVVDWAEPEIFTIVTWGLQTPYSGQIWYAQEEVWVYESLIKVIRQINKRVEATGPHNAAIKRVQAMRIGKNAADIVRSPTILQPLGSLTGGGALMGSGMDSMTDMTGSTSGSSDLGMGTDGMSAVPATESETLALIKRYRYVDQDMKPLSDTDTPPFAEFNMMPVCLELIVDQRKIPEILIECANSTMPIDVKLVRYNPALAKTGVLGGVAAGSMTDGMSTGMTGNSPGSGGGALSGAGASGRTEDAFADFEVGGKFGVYGSDAVMIQIVGIIYIFNEPSPELLATGASAQESGVEGGVDVVESPEAETETGEIELVVPDVTAIDEDPEEYPVIEEEPLADE